MSEGSPVPGGRVVLPTEPTARWARFGYVLALLNVGLAALNWDEPFGAGMYLVVAVGWLVLTRSWTYRRMELAEDELRLVTGLWTYRTAYVNITAVRGNIPQRLEWSDWLVVERRGHRLARSLALPVRRGELAAVKADIDARVAAVRTAAHQDP